MVTFVTYVTDVLTFATRNERVKTRRIGKWLYNIFIINQNISLMDQQTNTKN